MGRSEWGFLIGNKDDLIHVIDVVKLHNAPENAENAGETLEIYAMFKHRKKMYLCAGNGGGRESTSEFFVKNYKGPKIYWPFDKPKWWFDTKEEDYVWKLSNAPGLTSDAKMLQLSETIFN